MAQTAVGWIAEKMKKLTPPGYQIEISAMLEKAKQMEKEQHYNTWLTAEAEYPDDDTFAIAESFEQYYNETYGNEGV